MDLNDYFVPETGGALHVLDATGDIKLTWDPENNDETDAVRAQFDAWKAKGYSAFRVDRKGGAGERMNRFDPEARAIIMVPRMQGG